MLFRSLAEEAKERGDHHPFMDMPWGWVFRQAISPAEQAGFWKDEFVEPMGLILSGAIRESNVVDGDEPIEAGSSSRPGVALASTTTSPLLKLTARTRDKCC